MKVNDLFILHPGNSFELINTEISNTSGINFISRTAVSNGVIAQVVLDPQVEPYPAGFITVALGGSVLSSFVQSKPFYTAFHIKVLEPKQSMTLQEKMYYCACIQANAYRYNYGRQANRTLKNIELPDIVPEWVEKSKIMSITTATKPRNLSAMSISTWQSFQLKNLFRFEDCKCSVARELSDGDDCYYIGAKKNDNGIMRRVLFDESLMTKGNCIVFICDGQGSVGYANYMDRDFIGSRTLTVGYNEKLNKYNALFLVSVLDLEQQKYSFGRKYRRKLKDTFIKLPATDLGSPDWEFMEMYIKALPYSDRI